MRIAVVGATGMLGQHVVRHTLRAGHDLIALYRNPRLAAALPQRWRVPPISRWTPCPPKHSGGFRSVLAVSGFRPFRPLHTSCFLRPARLLPPRFLDMAPLI
jgi:hypothetical protein